MTSIATVGSISSFPWSSDRPVYARHLASWPSSPLTGFATIHTTALYVIMCLVILMCKSRFRFKAPLSPAQLPTLAWGTSVTKLGGNFLDVCVSYKPSTILFFGWRWFIYTPVVYHIYCYLHTFRQNFW